MENILKVTKESPFKPALDNMVRVALYCRVSTEEQAVNGISLDMQKSELTQYAIMNGYEIYDIYIDDGYTAGTLNRPELQRMLADSKNFNLILFTKLDRFNRSVRNYYKIMDVLDENKVNWKTIHEKYDTTTAMGRLHINIMLSVAENEIAVTSERIKSVQKDKALNKKEVLNNAAPIGYKIENKHMVIDENRVDVARAVFDKYLQTSSLRQTLKWFNTNYWGMSLKNLRLMLSNRIYVGIYDSPYGAIEDFCTPIIDAQNFAHVQRLLQINCREFKKKNKHVYIFSKLLFCPDCGTKLVGVPSKNYDGSIRLAYRCNRHFRDHICPNKYTVTEKVMEEYLMKNIKPELEKYNTRIKVEQKKAKKEKHVSQVPKIRAKMEKLQDMYLNDIIEKDMYAEKYSMLKAELEEAEMLDKKHTEVPKVLTPEQISKFVAMDFAMIYDNLDAEEKRRLWRSIIDKIFVHSRYDMDIKFL